MWQFGANFDGTERELGNGGAHVVGLQVRVDAHENRESLGPPPVQWTRGLVTAAVDVEIRRTVKGMGFGEGFPFPSGGAASAVPQAFVGRP